MQKKHMILLLLVASFAASLSFAFPPGQPGDNTCTEDLDSMVSYCEDYCTMMTGEVCVLCSTSVSERGVLDACTCQSPSTRKHVNFYNITCDIPVDEHEAPSQEPYDNETEETTVPVAPKSNTTQDLVTAINKTNTTTTINKSAGSQPKPSGSSSQSGQQGSATPCIGPAAIAFIACLALIGKRKD